MTVEKLIDPPKGMEWATVIPSSFVMIGDICLLKDVNEMAQLCGKANRQFMIAGFRDGTKMPVMHSDITHVARPVREGG